MAHTFPQPRSLAKFVADVAQCIDELEIDSEPTLAKSRSTGHLSDRHMAGSASKAILQQRKQSNAAVRPQSAGRLQRRRPSLEEKLDESARKPRMSRGRVPKAQTLKSVFETFAAGRERMRWRDFEELCSSSVLFDAQFMLMEARSLFDGMLRPGERSINYEQFEKLLRKVSIARQQSSGKWQLSSLETLHQKVLESVKCR